MKKNKKNMSDLKKRITNLLTKLRVDKNSVLFAKGDKQQICKGQGFI